MPVTATDIAGDFHPHPALCTQHVPTQAPPVMQHGYRFAYATSKAPKQATLWHSIRSLSSLGYTAPALMQNSEALFPSQSFTSAAGQGTGRTAISDHLLTPLQAQTSARAATSQTDAKTWPVQQVSGQGSLRLSYWHSLITACHKLSNLFGCKSCALLPP